MERIVFLLAGALLLASCTGPDRPRDAGIYYWKTVLDWGPGDTDRLARAGIGRLGLRLFDWGAGGEEGPLAVRSPVPGTLAVVPVAYVTTGRLKLWASDRSLDPGREAAALLAAMDRTLARAWPGNPETWQLDADWTAGTARAWFAVAASFRDLVHRRGARFEVTVRLHQYRDREAQGIPPADGGVLMLYGAGETVLDLGEVQAYLTGPAYPLPLTPAYPVYTQVRQYNGYGRLVGLVRIGSEGDLPAGDLEARGPGRYGVLRRTSLGDRTLLAHDELAVDRVDPAVLRAVAALPEAAALRRAAGDRVWVFDYASDGWEALVHGPLAPYLFPR